MVRVKGVGVQKSLSRNIPYAFKIHTQYYCERGPV